MTQFSQSDQFINQFSISKTLRFRLIPMGETATRIEQFKDNSLIQEVRNDEQRSLKYTKVKEIINDYHRHVIKVSLAEIEEYLDKDLLDTCFQTYLEIKKNNTSEVVKKQLQKQQEKLRNQVAQCLKENSLFKTLFKEQLFSKDLPNWLQQNTEDSPELLAEKMEQIKSFTKFTTYFSGFNQNRENLYTNKDQSTAIAHRLIHVNLSKFFDNCLTYQYLQQNTDLQLHSQLNLDLQHPIDYYFNPVNYIQFVTQAQIDEYNYLLGGKTNEDGSKQQGVNELINLYKQQLVRADKKDTAKKIAKMTPLYKQILSLNNSLSFIPIQFQDDQELLTAIHEYQIVSHEVIQNLFETLLKLSDYDSDTIHIKSSDIAHLSHTVLGYHAILNDTLEQYVQQTFTTKKDRNAFLKQPTYPLELLDQLASKYLSQCDDLEQKPSATPIQDYLSDTTTIKKLFIEQPKQYQENLSALLSLTELSQDRHLPTDQNPTGGIGFQQVERIKIFFDAHKQALHFAKTHYLIKDKKMLEVANAQPEFYSSINSLTPQLEEILNPLYNKIRNYLTKKTFDQEKFKINFERPTLLKGWDQNKETDNLSVILLKDNQYFLGIMHRNNNKLFEYYPQEGDGAKKIETKEQIAVKALANENDGVNCYRKMKYKLLPGASKTLPKICFSDKWQSEFSHLLTEEVLHIRNHASHTKGGEPQTEFEKHDFNIHDMQTMIHFFKECIKLYPGWKGYQFNFSPTENYQTINQFYAEVETGGYKIDFDNIKQTYIDQAVAEGKLYLFKIYNKDFSSYSKGTPNLHTLFWCHVFSPENLSDPVIKLNGEAEIFFRRHSIKDTKTTHPANQPLQNKNPLNKKQTSTFAYPLIKDKRYREDQFYFHVPLTLNRSPINNDLRNDQVNAFLKNNPDINIIGIDRGERHLLYLTVIDQQGKIIEQRSLNQISNKGEAPHDYQQKLDQREKQRAKARESWGTVENIKELKAGYLSLIVHEISKLVIEYNAIICLENLNFGFKRGRFKVEKQVYQKFEKALIDKLNYLCFKSQPLNESGSILKAYQLSSKFDSFEKLGLQTGIIFYVNPSYTSKIDPATGFVNLLGKQIRYQNVEQAKQLISNLNNFQFNLKPNHFEITLDYQKLKSNWKNKNYQSCWTICTHDERLVSTKTNNTWNTESIDITLQLKQLFDQYQIDYHNQTNLIESMLEITNSGFFKRLLWLLQITTSLRYSQPNDTEDFILSPVADKHGNFFDSRKSGTFLPQNGDANGAYHIALKGLWNLRQINNTPVDSNGFLKAKLTLSNDEWFNFVQTQPYRNSP